MGQVVELVDSAVAVSELKEDSVVLVDYLLEELMPEDYLLEDFLEELITSEELEETEESLVVPQSNPAVIQFVPKQSNPQFMPKKLEMIKPSQPTNDPTMFEHFRVLWMDTLFEKSILNLSKRFFPHPFVNSLTFNILLLYLFNMKPH